MRTLAGYDPTKYQQVLRFTVAEALESYEHLLREDARSQYQFDVLTWCVLAQSGASKKKTPPDVPAILKE